MVDRCLPLLSITLSLTRTVSIEDKVVLTFGTSVDIAHTGYAIFMTCLTESTIRYVNLLISLANFEAVVVESIKLHVALTAHASLGGARASLAAGIARLAPSARWDTDLWWS